MGETRGGARPGAGRKKTGRKYATIYIAGVQDEIESIKKHAKNMNKSVSRYVIDIVKKNWESESK